MGKNPENIRRRAKRGEYNRTVARLYLLPLPEFVHRCFTVAILTSWRCRSSRIASLSHRLPFLLLSRRLIERLCRDTEARRPVVVNTFPGKFEQIFDKTVASDNMAFDVHVTRSNSIAVDSYTIKNIFYLY